MKDEHNYKGWNGLLNRRMNTTYEGWIKMRDEMNGWMSWIEK